MRSGIERASAAPEAVLANEPKEGSALIGILFGVLVSVPIWIGLYFLARRLF
jgi:hypothetical protein